MTAKQVMIIVNREYKQNHNKDGYDNYIRVQTTTDQDAKARKAVETQINSFYSVTPAIFGKQFDPDAGSCLDVAQVALIATGKKFKHNTGFLMIVPNDWFVNFGWYNNDKMYNRVPAGSYIEVGPLSDGIIDD